jgi:hypothetical protein
MNYLVAILEYDEYNQGQFEKFYFDETLIESGGDTFFGYMDSPSDFSQLYFSTGPYSDNCIVLYYRQVGESDEITESDAESFYNVILDLKRNGNLFILGEADFNLLYEHMHGKFPIEDIDAACVAKTEFDC